MGARPLARLERRGATQIATNLAIILALVLVLVVTIAGAIVATIDNDYSIGEYMHDLTLLVIGLGAVCYAVRQPALSQPEPEPPPPPPTRSQATKRQREWDWDDE